jgi:hypothetical protein
MDDEGAIVIDEGAGGGDEGGVGGGEEELHDQGGDEGGDAGGGEREGGEEEEHGERREEDTEGDRRRLPLDVRKAVREITSKDPDFAKRFPKFEKEITGALFTRQKVNEMGGLQNIASTLETIEAHGGIEGIAQMAEDLEAANQLEHGLERGDPATIQGWSKDFPDGFKRSIVPMLDTLEKLDEERFEHVSSYVLTKTLERFGVFGAMSQLGKALEAKKPEDAVEAFNAVAKFLGDAKRLGANAKTDPYASRSHELDEREQSIEAKNLETFKSGVRVDVNTQVTNETNRLLRDELRAMKVFKVPSGTANRMRGEINRELKRLVAADPNYSRQYEGVMKSGDRARAVSFVTKTANKYLPRAIKQVVKDFGLRPTGRPAGGGGARRDAGGNNRGGEERTQVTNGYPKSSDVDFRRTEMATFLASRNGHGEAWLKNGKKAKW